MQNQTFDRSIRYDHGDYKMTLDGRVIGWARSYHEAETTLDQVVHEMLTHGDCATAEELDAPIEDAPVQMASWSTATASADEPPPDDGPGGPLIPGDTGYGKHAALALQTLLATQQQGLCLNCGEKHRTWACPEIARKLFAPDALDALVYETHELVRLWGASRSLLAIKLARLTPGQLTSQAIAFAAWLNKQTQANLPARSVLHVWQELISECDPALERVA